MLDGINPARFGAIYLSFPAMNYWVEVVGPTCMEGGWHAMEMSEPV